MENPTRDMKGESALDAVLQLTRKVEAQAKELRTAGTPVSRLDLDVMLADTRRMYELLLSLNRDNQPVKLVEKSESAAVEPESTEAESAVYARSTPAEDQSAGIEQEVTEEAQAGKRLHQKRSEKMSEHRPGSPGLFDEVPEPEGTALQSLHEKLARTTEKKSLADKLSSAPAGDLKKIIGINEKFKFVNDLFEGSLQDYNDCINKINGAGTLHEAEALMEQAVLEKNDTGKESDTYQSLRSLVQKKFNR